MQSLLRKHSRGTSTPQALGRPPQQRLTLQYNKSIWLSRVFAKQALITFLLQPFSSFPLLPLLCPGAACQYFTMYNTLVSSIQTNYQSNNHYQGYNKRIICFVRKLSRLALLVPDPPFANSVLLVKSTHLPHRILNCHTFLPFVLRVSLSQTLKIPYILS